MTRTILDTLTRLHSALDDLARALVTGRSDAVLAAEEPLAAAVRQLVAESRVGPIGRSVEIRTAIRDARLALARCRALGQSAGEFAQAALPNGPYSRAGLHVIHAPSSVDSRT